MDMNTTTAKGNEMTKKQCEFNAIYGKRTQCKNDAAVTDIRHGGTFCKKHAKYMGVEVL
jgi:hypothetical protein